jgi:hypothetical protein
MLADPSGHAVSGVDMKPLACWDRKFESCQGHGCSSLVFAMCYVGSGFFDELITISEGAYRVRVQSCVI